MFESVLMGIFILYVLFLFTSGLKIILKLLITLFLLLFILIYIFIFYIN